MLERSGGGGWRKRIHSRPGAAKLNPEERALPETDADSLRPPSERPNWRNTFHSRPGTPSRALTPTVFQVDTDDVRREVNLDVPSSRKVTKPKLSRYFSGYLTIKDASKEPEFCEPWLEMPPPTPEYADPMASLQSVFSHMTTNPSCPIPLHHNNGIFRVFEDYRKIRQEKDRLETLLHKTFEGYRTAEMLNDRAEAEYQAEIHRLKLVIAHGNFEIDSVTKPRNYSTIERTQTHMQTTSKDTTAAYFEDVPMAQLDEQIRMRSQQVLLQRPVSPSSKMAMLSRRLENAQSSSDFVVGTPPIQDKKGTLSRKVQSELNLARLEGPGIAGSFPRSVDSGFSGNGDPLPDEVDPLQVILEPTIDLEAFVALKELGSLVARKRGIDANMFQIGLMQLYSMDPANSEHEPSYEAPNEDSNMSSWSEAGKHIKVPSTPERIVRHVRSQPLLGSDKRTRRHFSFEPGDDQLAALGRNLTAHDAEGAPIFRETDTAFSGQMLPSQRSVSRNASIHKPSKIPSPLQRPGLESIRRGSSNSSIRTVLRRSDTEERRNNRSSGLTTFRQGSSKNLRPVSQSQGGSVHTSTHSEDHSSASVGSSGVRRNFAVIAAAEAVDQADNSVHKKSTA